jgi:hypothetical protein
MSNYKIRYLLYEYNRFSDTYTKNLEHNVKQTKLFYQSLALLMFKRLEVDDDSFKDYLSDLNMRFETQNELDSEITRVIIKLAELRGIFSAITR